MKRKRETKEMKNERSSIDIKEISAIKKRIAQEAPAKGVRLNDNVLNPISFSIIRICGVKKQKSHFSLFPQQYKS